MFRCTLLSADDGKVRLALPGSDYRLTLSQGRNATELRAAVGTRVRGTIDARALRVHRASGGGRFIEPIDGAPRIVQGAVLDVDVAGRRLLIDVAAPLWITLQADQPATEFATGDLVNCYLASGATFSIEM